MCNSEDSRFGFPGKYFEVDLNYKRGESWAERHLERSSSGLRQPLQGLGVVSCEETVDCFPSLEVQNRQIWRKNEENEQPTISKAEQDLERSSSGCRQPLQGLGVAHASVAVLRTPGYNNQQIQEQLLRRNVNIQEQLLRRNLKGVRGGLVFEAQRLVYHST